jgi:NAD(P)-dependent dehydrogenase (short-subunit alcohol dehydrogenase family)
LDDLQLLSEGIRTFEVDVLDKGSIDRAAQDFGQGPLDILIYVAGLYHKWDDKAFSELSAADLLGYFQVNAVVRTHGPPPRARCHSRDMQLMARPRVLSKPPRPFCRL